MMQYMSQAFFFYIKTGAGALQKMESGAVECSLTCQKAGRKIFCRKNEKNQNTC